MKTPILLLAVLALAAPARATLAEAQAALDAGDAVRALSLAQQAEAEDPKDPRPHDLAAKAALSLNLVEQAKSETRRAQAVRAQAAAPGADADRLAAMDALRRGDYAEADRAATRALAANPDNAFLLETRSAARHHSGRDADALADADRAVALEPQAAMGHFSRAVALSALARSEESLQELRRAAELDPRFAASLPPEPLPAPRRRPWGLIVLTAAAAAAWLWSRRR
jgi:tetratricopeptide (TPR) repeat protein